ncbi:hypothetical protein D6D01_02284 [Aureobasidium pullulans]|uniref:Uncharacterized protein n=1 Tax=Aureobasidium pullulans TaxID=5580 RepID=A0A4V6TF24_AURPU|nr:hypothetical protein D6D01_02284 [Aureobasidium pullulans]
MALMGKVIWLLMALVALLVSSHYEVIAMDQTMPPSRLEKLASLLAWASDEPPDNCRNCDKDYCYPCYCDEDLRYLETGKRKYSLLDKQRKADRLLSMPGLSDRFLIPPEYIFEYLEIISAQQRLIRLAAIAHADEDIFKAYMAGVFFEP